MFIAPFLSVTALVVFGGSLLFSVLVYLRDIKTKIVPAANLCMILVFVISMITIVNTLAAGIDDPSKLAETAAVVILMNIFAGLFNAATRVSVRVIELAGRRPKKLKLSIKAEFVER